MFNLTALISSHFVTVFLKLKCCIWWGIQNGAGKTPQKFCLTCSLSLILHEAFRPSSCEFEPSGLSIWTESESEEGPESPLWCRTFWGCTCKCWFIRSVRPHRCQMCSSLCFCFSVLFCFSSLFSSSPPLYCWLLELSGDLSDANWWVNRSGVSPPPPLSHTNTHIHLHKYTRPPGTSCRTKWLATPARHLPLSPGVRFGGSGCCSSPAGVHSLTHTHAHTHTRTDTHSLLVSPAHPPPAFTPQTAGQQENTHTHEGTDRRGHFRDAGQAL